MDVKYQVLEKAGYNPDEESKKTSKNTDSAKQSRLVRSISENTYDTQLTICRQGLVAMNANKEITALLPPKTRFRFLKRVIRKLIKFITRYQQNFNFAAYSVAETSLSVINELVERINALEEENRQIKLKLYGRETHNTDINGNEEKACSLSGTDNPNTNKLKVQIQGPFETTYSLALVNKNLAQALEKGGYTDTSIYATESTGIYTPEEKYLIDKPFAKMLYEKGNEENKPDVTIANMYPPTQPYLTGEFNFQYFAWEEDKVPQKYVRWFNDNLDGVGTLSEFITQALIDSGLTIPVRTIGCGVQLPDNFESISPYPLKTNKKIRFLHISSAFPRKGVDILLKGYFKAFTSKDNVCLVLKTFNNPHNNVGEILARLQKQYPDGPEVEWINADLSQRSLMALYKAADCYVQVARGEGFGLPVAEAMLAKLPVIASNNSGLADFCNKDTCVTINYKITQAFSHLSEGNSQWAEPDEEELILRMRDFVYNRETLSLERKVENAYALISEEFSWDAVAKRWKEFVDEIINKQQKPSVDMVTTWNTKCGIAEFSRYQVENTKHRVDYCIYPNVAEKLVQPDETYVKERIWLQDYNNANVEELARQLLLSASDTIHIQYTPAFFSLDELAKLIVLVGKNKRIMVEFHNTKIATIISPESREKIIKALNSVHKIVVHQIEDINNLTNEGINENLIQVIKLGQPVFRDRNKDDVRKQLGISASYVVGSYGFLFPHKGILKTIKAIKLLKRKYPDILYLVVCSKYDNPNSQKYYTECMDEIAKHGLEKNVIMFPEFLPVEVSSTLLQACDVIVMAYDKSNESASGAARFCISVNRPFITTKQNIFKEFSACSYQIANNNPRKIAKGIRCIIHKPDAYKDQIRQKITETNWKTTSDKYIEVYKN